MTAKRADHVQMLLRVPPELRAKIKAAAAIEQVTAEQWMEQVLRDRLERERELQ